MCGYIHACNLSLWVKGEAFLGMRQEAQRSEGRKGHFQAPYEQEEGVLATETEMDCVSKQIASTLSELWGINLLCKQSKMLAN